ncbi:MAG TPA: type II toxin-antitoxin system VapC family toxin [Chthoniobacteraceae bacterium]|nr:type II toxin-antitoxin system VapC family toxin [Chthoniobacteraceae bacterium]
MLFAVDTNVLLDQALDDADVLDALGTIRLRVKAARFVVTPTVIEELAWQAGQSGEKQRVAILALENLLSWGYEPLNLIPVGRGVVEAIGLKMRLKGIIDEAEVHDSEIIAEAALIGCNLLLTSDAHLLNAQEGGALRGFLKECDVEGDDLVIGSPRIIVEKFFQRR